MQYPNSYRMVCFAFRGASQDTSAIAAMGDVFMASIKTHAYGHDFLCEGDKVSTLPHDSCKNPLHELVERRRTFRSSRLSSWQSAGDKVTSRTRGRRRSDGGGKVKNE